MKTKSTEATAADPLHGRAGDERQVRQKGLEANSVPLPSPADAMRQLHELQVHQVELEMRNAELKRIRNELEAALQNYTELYEFAPVGYFSLDSRGIIHQVNLSAAQLVGTERGLLMGKALVSFVSPELRGAFDGLLKKVFAREAMEEGEFILPRKALPPVSVGIRASRPPHSHTCNLVIIDLTRHKQAEEKLRMSEIRYRRLFETAHDGVLLLDPVTCKITDANPFMSQLLDYPQAQLLGKELFEIGLHKDKEASREMFRGLKHHHEVRYEDLPLQSRSGKHQEVEVVANLYQEDGHAVIQCNIRDITQRKLAEDDLRRNEALFAALVEQAPVGVIVLDVLFRLQQVNPVARLTFSASSAVVGQGFFEIMRGFWPKRVSDQIAKTFRHTMESGEGYQASGFTERRRDTRKVESYDWQVQRVTLPAGIQGLVCFFSDISLRKKAEDAQRRLEVMTASNRKLQLEIIRRRELEKSLRKSQRDQTRLLQHSRTQQEELRGISHLKLMAQEEERKRISRELHDVIAQSLVGINVHLAALGKDGAIHLTEFQEKVTRTRMLVEQSVNMVHEFARELRPTVLDDLGLIPALKACMRNFMEDSGIRVDFKVFAGVEQCPDVVRTVLYRVTNAALANVVLHAHASLVEVIIQRNSGVILLEIKDNGKGFDAGAALAPGSKKHRRLGLLGMRERVEMIGGIFEIHSVPGEATTVRAEFPESAWKEKPHRLRKPGSAPNLPSP